MKKRLLISTSGGRSSAVLAYMLWNNPHYRENYEMAFVFANTSREDDRTLDFVRDLEINFGLPIVWVQAVVHHGQRKSSTHEITNYQDAKRNGEVFEEVIKKYGIPNKMFKMCTRELKQRPIEHYVKTVLGWDDFTTVLGYRADEPKRVNLLRAAKLKQWYPLWEWGIKKPDVARFWLRQPFDLQLEDWEGNCRLCHKKSERKILTQIKKDPESTVWVGRMEKEHGYNRPPQFTGILPTTFFRGHKTIAELIEQSKQPFKLAVDKSLITDGAEYDYDLDEQESCGESCEPFGEDYDEGDDDQ